MQAAMFTPRRRFVTLANRNSCKSLLREETMLVGQVIKLAGIAAGIALATALFAFSAAFAHEQHEQGGEGNPEILGSVDFQTSCAPGGAADFNRAMALLHSFWY